TGGVRSDFGSFADFLLGLPDSTQRQIGGEPANLSSFQYAFFVQNDWRIKPWLTLNLGVRYDLTAPLKERDNRLSNFLPDLGISVCASGEFRNPADNSLVCRSAAEVGLPNSLVRTDKNNIAPRVGFALRPFKDDKTVIRGGAGVFYSIETVNPARQQLAVSFPYVTRQLFARNANNLLGLSFQNAFNGVGGLDGLNTPLGIPVNSRVPEVYQYNLTIERELARDLAFEVGYVGTQARFLGLRYDLNASVFNPDGSRTPPRFPTLGNIQYQVQAANSNYHGLQSSLRRRTRNGLSLLVSYTFSKSMDMNSNTNNSTTGVQRNPQNINDFRNEYALSDFHRTHQFSGSFNYDLPFGKGKPFFNDTRGISEILVGGWQLNGIVTHTSGRPFTPQFSAPDVTQQRPDLIGDPYQNIPEGFLFNPFAFAVPNIRDGDLYGNAGRNILTGPSYNRTDLSLFKVLRFGEKTRLQLRWEVFNVFNNPNYRLPTFLLPDNITEIRDANGMVTTPAFTIDELRTRTNVGRPTELATNMREMQFAVRLIF
ncbi:MAG: TonB-dependent receptor, partial [Pyrinomonadaceae bacterium]|nr:TonB-dependent receptor [Pyrinomonadaceae bacterium]